MLQSGQYMRVIVQQRGIDVVVSLMAPDGTKLAESDSDNGNFGPEPASLIAGASGQYLVEIRSPEHGLEQRSRPTRFCTAPIDQSHRSAIATAEGPTEAPTPFWSPR